MIIFNTDLRLAYVKHKGPIQADGFIQLVMDIVSHPHYVPNINVLYDYRLADFSRIRREDMDKFYNYLTHQRKNMYNQISIVVDNDDDFITSSIWQSYSSGLPHKRKVFKSIFQGESWLFENALPQIKNRYQAMNSHLEKIKNNRDHHVVDQDGTILDSTVTAPLDNIPLQGRKIPDILHDAYAYPFMCLLRRVIKTRKKAWMNLRVGHQDYAECITPIDRNKAHVTEFVISGMGEYEVERLKWYHDEHKNNAVSQTNGHHCPIQSTLNS
jgi:hypothetical protein